MAAHRTLATGIGEAVAKRTILRTINGKLETWGDVAERVSLGNATLLPWGEQQEHEYRLLKKHISNASILMSGRHLQHGDETQRTRNQEVFTNCSTASSSFLLFYLLMNGSGVGRAYDDDLCLADWSMMPFVRVVLSTGHPDFDWSRHENVDSAKKKYPNAVWHEVADTREGWAEAVEIIETMAYARQWEDTLVLDFSNVRAKGAPIHGMQGRPASGPAPIMKAIENVSSLKGTEMPVWEQTLWVDHYLAECVLVGGARRSARIATKNWRDDDVIDFVRVKRGGFLWSANNSITVDEDFWKLDTDRKKEILEAVLDASYHDGTGEPGFINQHKLTQKDEGLEIYDSGDFAESKKYIVSIDGKEYLREIAIQANKKQYTQITNPCGEISLHVLGGYCVIADVVPYFAESDEEAEEAFRVATRALMRVNLMDSLYKKETTRTNRIGVGMTGVHEYAWKRFGLSFRDLVDEEKSKDFWEMLKRFKLAVDDEAEKYAAQLHVTVPHTNTTIKPAGTTSKLFALTEGVHLPAMREYLRWVQFRYDDPLVEEYKKKGYPFKELQTYQGTTVIGFPTQPEICKLGMGDALVTAGEATPEEQYKWLMLLEKYWIDGSDKNTGNQVSYTLKYKPGLVSYEQYKLAITKYQSQVRCCSVMPQGDMTAYEYQPEQPITSVEYAEMISKINGNAMEEDVDKVHVDCESGACPVDFNK